MTRNNQATGGWWLYKWYGELTGNTVAVTPPSVSGSLQGVAALDAAKQQARVIFGGNNLASGSYDTDVVIRNVAAAPYLGTTVHATVWGVDSSGLEPSSGPYLVREGDFTVSGGQVTIPLTGLRGSSAYQVILTPNTDLSATGPASRYQAEYARTDGSARITHGGNTGYSGTSFVQGYGGSTSASTKFVTTVPSDGYYTLALRYSAGPYAGAPANRSIRLRLNGSDLTDLALSGTTDWNTWNTATIKAFLPAGISRLEVNAFAADDRDAVNIDYLDVAPTTGTITTYEAESSANTLAGTARVASNSGASGGQHVGFVGAGAGNTLRFNNVTVPAAGRYRMVVAYANAEVVGNHQYNNNIVDRMAEISVNGGAPQRAFFRNTLSWSTFRTTVVDVQLAAGANTISFGNPTSGYAPDIDLIRIAAPTG
ncbi:CBM35 domain-containing protein [Nonomuraea thailandensis]